MAHHDTESAEDVPEIPLTSFAGKKAVVTGGSRGIGRAIALTLAASGADVAITYYTGDKFAADVCARVRDMGRHSACYGHDIAELEEVERVAAEVLREFGHIDILVNNAGINRDRSFKKMSREMWDSVLAVDLTGVFHTTKQFIEPMAERGWGRVINISSIVGQIGNFGQANYAAAKAGVIGMTKTLAREYASKGVTVNAIAPGFIKTRMVLDIPDKSLAKLIDRIPLGRLGRRAEVAAGVAFLASPAASYITGHVLDINGGMAMGG